MATRSQSDETWVLDLCDAIIGERSERQRTFDWLRGDPSLRTGRRAKLPVDGYWPGAKIVVEYRERQHYESLPHFDKPDRLTATGSPRREQRAHYDQIREVEVPRHGLQLVIAAWSDLDSDERGRLHRNTSEDSASLVDLLDVAVNHSAPRRDLRKEFKRREIHTRIIVGRTLGVVVRPHDTGERPGMVDAIFNYADGRSAALEVTRVRDSDRAKQWGALRRQDGSRMDGLRKGWYVRTSSSTRVKQVPAPLRRLLLDLESRGVDEVDFEHTNARTLSDDGVRLKANGIRLVSVWSGAEAGAVYYASSAMVGCGADPRGIPGWITRVVQSLDRADNVRKLDAQEVTGERHLFLWAEDRTASWLQPVMDSGIPADAPAPDLPDGVTHVWLATGTGRWIAWFPDCGWWMQ